MVCGPLSRPLLSSFSHSSMIRSMVVCASRVGLVRRRRECGSKAASLVGSSVSWRMCSPAAALMIPMSRFADQHQNVGSGVGWADADVLAISVGPHA